jgi:hypothetical protein
MAGVGCPATDWAGRVAQAIPCNRPVHKHGLCRDHCFGGIKPRLPPRLAPNGILFEELVFHRPHTISARGRAARPVLLGRCTGTVASTGQRCQNCTTLPRCPACLLRRGLLIDVQRICPEVVELGLFVTRSVPEDTPLVDMYSLEVHPAPPRSCRGARGRR